MHPNDFSGQLVKKRIHIELNVYEKNRGFSKRSSNFFLLYTLRTTQNFFEALKAPHKFIKAENTPSQKKT